MPTTIQPKKEEIWVRDFEPCIALRKMNWPYWIDRVPDKNNPDKIVVFYVFPKDAKDDLHKWNYWEGREDDPFKELRLYFRLYYEWKRALRDI